MAACEAFYFAGLKRRRARSVSTRLISEGQLKERSEGVKHSGKPRSEKCWRRVLINCIKLAALVLARCVPKPAGRFCLQSFELRDVNNPIIDYKLNRFGCGARWIGSLKLRP